MSSYIPDTARPSNLSCAKGETASRSDFAQALYNLRMSHHVGDSLCLNNTNTFNAFRLDYDSSCVAVAGGVRIPPRSRAPLPPHIRAPQMCSPIFTASISHRPASVIPTIFTSPSPSMPSGTSGTFRALKISRRQALLGKDHRLHSCDYTISSTTTTINTNTASCICSSSPRLTGGAHLL